ncbi:hypothetical protein ACO0LN_21705 [Undibacterium sp. TC9W]
MHGRLSLLGEGSEAVSLDMAHSFGQETASLVQKIQTSAASFRHITVKRERVRREIQE